MESVGRYVGRYTVPSSPSFASGPRESREAREKSCGSLKGMMEGKTSIVMVVVAVGIQILATPSRPHL